MHPLLRTIEAQGLPRRAFLRNLLLTAGSISAASALTACGSDGPRGNGVARSRFADIGPLQAPDENGVSLPAGFTSRVVAVAGEQPLPASSPFEWIRDPDGAGVFALPDGGWIYIANSEVRDATSGGLVQPLQPIVSRENVAALGTGLRGGVGALRFAADGTLVDAYRVLENTTTNCSGVATPWGTWLSGEEITDGYVFECDPLGGNVAGRRLDIFGRKGHEQFAIDVDHRTIYHTEDFGGDDRFYRNVFSEADWPRGQRPQLEDGVLQVLVVEGGIAAARQGPAPIRWVDAVNDGRPQRQVYSDETTVFAGNEGCWFLDGFVFFSTKSDDNIWAIDTVGQTVESIYSPQAQPDGSPVDPDEPALFGVDNLLMTDDGDIVCVEDGGDMRAMVLMPDGVTIPLLRLPDNTVRGSEVSGPAFSPDGRRFYCSSMRCGRNGGRGTGITYEITMPFAVRVSPPMAGIS
ncbi:alkaline phosphatase PhoX [Algiphilus sp.]|uniref:alkaline phosphatase PhoX n=1 Tax=Algiphilus sp. TaxID=1872431 RepID=UPI0025BAECB0|nr:alkaline phosphatase PhoX [Algiphilus sp.]MCK5771523.1 DUF839 domain-containing protein [Algiphilus sp.]